MLCQDQASLGSDISSDVRAEEQERVGINLGISLTRYPCSSENKEM